MAMPLWEFVQLWHTLRRADGTWTGLGDVESQFVVPGAVTAVAGTGGAPGETQFIFATMNGRLWHTLRKADGSWTGLGDVASQFAIPGPVTAVAAANGGSGQTQFMFTTNDGHLWHTLRKADGSWTRLGDVASQFAIPGPVTAVAGTGGAPGETQFIFTTSDGHLWHTLRKADGSWTGLGDVASQANVPEASATVAAADAGSGETRFMYTNAKDGYLYDASRLADASWVTNLDAGLAWPGPVVAVAGTGGASGDTQFMFTTEDGHLWLTLNGTELTDVQAQFTIPNPVGVVSAASGAPGETQFMFTTHEVTNPMHP
jgi:hypothetical protein